MLSPLAEMCVRLVEMGLYTQEEMLTTGAPEVILQELIGYYDEKGGEAV